VGSVGAAWVVTVITAAVIDKNYSFSLAFEKCTIQQKRSQNMFFWRAIFSAIFKRGVGTPDMAGSLEANFKLLLVDFKRWGWSCTA
jgi:hypothetical protein